MSESSTAVAFTPIPSVDRMAATSIDVAAAAPSGATAIGVPIATDGELPSAIGVGRDRLTAAGFDAQAGSTLVLPGADGATVIAVGVGNADALDANSVRNAAAAFARAAGAHERLAFDLSNTDAVAVDAAAQAVVEGVLLARYRYDPLRRAPKGTPVSALTVVSPAGSMQAATTGV